MKYLKSDTDDIQLDKQVGNKTEGGNGQINNKKHGDCRNKPFPLSAW